MPRAFFFFSFFLFLVLEIEPRGTLPLTTFPGLFIFIFFKPEFKFISFLIDLFIF